MQCAPEGDIFIWLLSKSVLEIEADKHQHREKHNVRDRKKVHAPVTEGESKAAPLPLCCGSTHVRIMKIAGANRDFSRKLLVTVAIFMVHLALE